jgi:hypothetical protein
MGVYSLICTTQGQEEERQEHSFSPRIHDVHSIGAVGRTAQETNAALCAPDPPSSASERPQVCVAMASSLFNVSFARCLFSAVYFKLALHGAYQDYF